MQFILEVVVMYGSKSCDSIVYTACQAIDCADIDFPSSLKYQMPTGVEQNKLIACHLQTKSDCHFICLLDKKYLLSLFSG